MDIIANILQVAVGGAKKTHIMYGCNLSFEQLETYLSFLLGRELLRVVSEKGGKGNPASFQTTAKGQDFLFAHRNLIALLTT